ncbi:MAG TPA: homoserine dehydrogenase [Chloroflexota bacterium]|nr:homoserine dehydrogenase [Chloroflexota bacterium]
MQGAIGVGMLGLGIVGSGVAQALLTKADSIARRVGRPVVLQRALVRTPDKPRALAPALLTTNPAAVLDDPAIEVVVEVLGGEQPAHQYILAAIERGKHVVTANKEVMAKYGPEILESAAARGVDVAFEASVGGGIPVIGAFRLDLLANDLQEVTAIINGTTNYILTKMAREGVDYETALAEAQALGYAEADPRNDVDGIDAAYKLTILATLAFHARMRPADVYAEGIARLAAADFRYARELGYAIKLLAIGRATERGLELRVHPAFLPADALLANVDGVYNAVSVEGDLVGRVLFYGRGAGAGPTSSAVVADVIDIAQRLHAGRLGGEARAASPLTRLLPPLDEARRVLPMQDVWTRYYLRLIAADRPGVIAQITHVLGEHEISLASVIQKEDVVVDAASDLRHAEIVLMTHRAHEAAMQRAVALIAELPTVARIGSLIRVEG